MGKIPTENFIAEREATSWCWEQGRRNRPPNPPAGVGGARPGQGPRLEHHGFFYLEMIFLLSVRVCRKVLTGGREVDECWTPIASLLFEM